MPLRFNQILSTVAAQLVAATDLSGIPVVVDYGTNSDEIEGYLQSHGACLSVPCALGFDAVSEQMAGGYTLANCEFIVRLEVNSQRLSMVDGVLTVTKSDSENVGLCSLVEYIKTAVTSYSDDVPQWNFRLVNGIVTDFYTGRIVAECSFTKLVVMT